MDKLIEILQSFNPSITDGMEKKIVTDGVIDSVDIVSLISELEDEVFDEIRLYLDLYIAGDPAPVPENRVYLESTLNPTFTS